LLDGDEAWLRFSRDPDNAQRDSFEGFGFGAAPRVEQAAPGERPPEGPRAPRRAPHLRYPGWLYDWYESHPFGALLSAASCRLLWDRWGLLPALAAHHLPVVLLVALLLGVLVAWSARRWGPVAAAGAGAALLLAPRFLCDAFNNLKDAPEAVLYALALLAWASALRRARLAGFAVAGMLTGLALAQKANALFLAPHVLAFFLLANLRRWRRGEARLAFPWLGLALAAGCGLLAWLAVSPMLWTDTLQRVLIQVDYFASQGRQSYVEQDWDGPRAFLFTTPPVLLLLAALGAANRRACGEHRLLLGLGVLLPVGRTALPGAINFDGVRHFLEFMPFLALLAGLGLDLVLRASGRLATGWGAVARAAGGTALALGLFTGPLLASAGTWPFGNCYWSGLAGGLGGAQARGWTSATDYWGASYWQAFDWISQHAEPGAGVAAPVAWHVAEAVAPLRLRADLRLIGSGEPDDTPLPPVLYVAYITHPPFYGPMIWALEDAGEPLHALRVQGAPILKVQRIVDPARMRELLGLYRGLSDPQAAARRVEAWLAGL
ncbi:MAG: hypothetical protein FJ296_11195, partial [Planctomycetes bacterium]|nr:hypothetical protein [Planctomycetota bacterium]